MLSDETYHRLMTLLADNPQLSQRELARELGISLGKANYCLRALIRKGWVKAANFKSSGNRKAYMYLLTPRGIEQKGQLAMRYLQIKMQEYEALRVEIEQLRQQAEAGRARHGESTGVAGDQ